MSTSTDQSYTIVGPRGERLYPSPRSNPAKFRNLGTLPRDMRRAVTPLDWAEMVTLSAKLAASDPSLMGAIRQRAEWAFAGDSWQPIFYGGNNSKEWEAWGDLATEWLTGTVFPNAVRCNPRKDLIKAMQVSAMGWTIHGGDLALFSRGAGGLPVVTIIPGPRIGNGSKEHYASTVTSGAYSYGQYTLNGFAICQGGRYDGYRIYNGFIFDDEDEVVAVRVIGLKRGAGNDWQESYADFDLGFAHGSHIASEYDWHGMGRPLPRLAASLVRLQQKFQADDNIFQGINLATLQTVLHKLAPGQDAASARGNALTPVTIPASSSASGEDEVLYIEYSKAGDVKYIGADEDLIPFDYKTPHPNIEDFLRRMRSEILLDLGWPYELTDLSSAGRAPTRLSCELANNSLWQTQCTGETRLLDFVKFAVATGIDTKAIPAPPPGPLLEPYRWTFGYPKEMSVDQGNDVTASLNRLRYGLTSQRIESARWGFVLKRIRRDRQKEVFSLVDDAADLVAYAKQKGHELPFQRAIEFFYQPSANAASIPATPAEAGDDPNTKEPKTQTGATPADKQGDGE